MTGFIIKYNKSDISNPKILYDSFAPFPREGPSHVEYVISHMKYGSAHGHLSMLSEGDLGVPCVRCLSRQDAYMGCVIYSDFKC